MSHFFPPPRVRCDLLPNLSTLLQKYPIQYAAKRSTSTIFLLGSSDGSTLNPISTHKHYVAKMKASGCTPDDPAYDESPIPFLCPSL